MKLIYYRNLEPDYFLQDVDFNFSFDYEIKVECKYQDEEKNKCAIVDIEIEQIKDKFDIYSDLPYISDVTVLVGKNGIGKSTALDSIRDFFLNGYLRHSYEVLITESFILLGDRIKLSDKSIENLDKSVKNLDKFFPNFKIYFSDSNQCMLKVKSKKKEALKPGSSVLRTSNDYILSYYSNEVNPSNFSISGNELSNSVQKYEEPIKFIDLSTTDQILKSNQWGVKSQLLKERLRSSNLASYEDYDLRSMLELIEKDNALWNLIPESIKNKMEIDISLSGLPSDFLNYCINEIGNEKIAKLYPKFNILTYSFNSSWYANLLSNFIVSLVFIVFDNTLYQNEGSTEEKQISIVEIINDFETSVSETKISINTNGIYNLKEVRELFDKYVSESKYIPKLSGNNFLINNINTFLTHILNNNKLREFRVGGVGIYGKPFRVDVDLQLLIKVRNQIAILESTDNFRISFFRFRAKKISSGERNYLQMIMRLGSALKPSLNIMNDNTENLHALLLMDEPINAFHPEWQLQFINRMFQFFEKIHTEFNNVKFQLIVSSHSPFLLSNVTNDHVIRLKKKGDKTIKAPYEIDNQIFGANIYDLLNDTFFLENGFIGEFAQNKIDKCFKDLSSDTPIVGSRRDEIKNIIEINGDPLIKRELVRAYDEKFTDENLEAGFIVDQIKRLEKIKLELEKRNDQPK